VDHESPLAKRSKSHAVPQTQFKAPLAERLRPQRLDDVVGHHQLVGESSPMRRLIQAGRMGSIILWGPPGYAFLLTVTSFNSC
jgi:replication-associated recombination protein RarA